ncbi:MAG: hypothetical protein JNM66_29050 [Bryobacterales bacterium]|nr:hypothetical protein [Bryobacterales bacterium]
MKQESKAAAELIADALRSSMAAMAVPLEIAAEGVAKAEAAYRKSIRAVAMDQLRIEKEKVDGSRLTKHRFTSRLPLR